VLRDLISEREKELPVSTIGKLITIAEEDKSIISLGAGELDCSSSKGTVAAAKRALDRGETHYSPPQGRKDLREALVKKLGKENRIRVSPEGVVVTAGATEGILLGLMCCVDPGEGVLIPDPGFLAFRPAVEVLNGMPISIPLEEENGFSYDVDVMERVIIPEKTKAMIINSPSNPTGTVLKRKELEEIADFANEYGLLIISDEAYEKFVYGERHVSIGGLNGMEDRVLSLFSFSKSSAMPGFRVGYAAGPEKLIQAMTKLHIFTSICAPTVSQVAALEALKDRKGIEGIVREYDRRRKFLVKRVGEIPGFSCMEPKGAFYVFPSIKEFGISSMKFSELILKKASVAVVPGTEFGRMGEGFVRISYATELGKIKTAMGRIERVAGKI